MQLFLPFFSPLSDGTTEFKVLTLAYRPLSYGHLCEMVDHVFPLLFRDKEADFASSETMSQGNYWSDQLPDGSQLEAEEPQLLETS